MSRYCCVNSCTSFWTPFTHLSFFKLPVENEQLKNKWLNVGPGYKSFTKYSKICSDHFLPEDYRILGGKRFLNKNAVPSVFKGPEECSLNEQDCSSSTAETNRITEMTDVSEMEYKCNVGTQVSLNNSELEDNERPRKKFGSVLVQTESRILGPSQEVKDLRHQLKLLKDRLRRKDERIVNIKKLVQRLKDRAFSYQKNMAFTGKVVLITGASSGIGAATAIHLSQLGAHLSITGRNLQNLERVASECKKPKPFIVVGELTSEIDRKNVIDSTIKHYGKLDVLINNAGILENGSIENTSLEQYDRVFDTNVKQIYHLTMMAVPHLIKSKGNIVNVSSVNGMRSFPGVLAYCMSKAAVDQFTRCVALELADKQIRVNSVNPGVTVTNLHKNSGMSEEQLKNFFERSKTTHALGRPGDVTEVAKTIAFLASEDASFITGATIPVDGGRHAMCPR